MRRPQFFKNYRRACRTVKVHDKVRHVAGIDVVLKLTVLRADTDHKRYEAKRDEHTFPLRKPDAWELTDIVRADLIDEDGQRRNASAILQDLPQI